MSSSSNPTPSAPPTAIPLGPILPPHATLPARFPTSTPLVGKHVTLERLSTTHTSPLWTTIGSHLDLWAQLPSGPFTSYDVFTQYIKKYQASTDHAYYAVIPHLPPPQGEAPAPPATAAGIMGIWAPDLANRSTEIGPVIYGAPLQRSRAGTEAFLLIASHIFDETEQGLNFRRLEWRFNSVNGASRRAAERYGFMYEGTFRQHMVVKGRGRDTCVYSLLGEEWEGSREVLEGWLEDGNFDEGGRQRRSLGEVREDLRKGREGGSVSGILVG